MTIVKNQIDNHEVVYQSTPQERFSHSEKKSYKMQNLCKLIWFIDFWTITDIGMPPPYHSQRNSPKRFESVQVFDNSNEQSESTKNLHSLKEKYVESWEKERMTNTFFKPMENLQKKINDAYNVSKSKVSFLSGRNKKSTSFLHRRAEKR